MWLGAYCFTNTFSSVTYFFLERGILVVVNGGCGGQAHHGGIICVLPGKNILTLDQIC